VRRTFATLRKAELGFLGVVVYTLVHTPLRCGQLSKARDLLLALMISLPFLTNCCIVGILTFYFSDGEGSHIPLKMKNNMLKNDFFFHF
jgi:hypothetical protein